MEPKRPAAGRVEETEPEEWWSGGGDGSKMFSVTLLRMRALLPALAGRTTRWHLSPFSNAFFHWMATTELAEFADDWVAFVCVVACQCVCLWDAHYFLKDSLRIRLGSMMAGRDWKREFLTILWALCTAIPKDPSMILRDLRRGGRRSRGRRGGEMDSEKMTERMPRRIRKIPRKIASKDLRKVGWGWGEGVKTKELQMSERKYDLSCSGRVHTWS